VRIALGDPADPPSFRTGLRVTTVVRRRGEVSMTTPGGPADARAVGVEPRTMDAVLGA
jgi:hypothetical protein